VYLHGVAAPRGEVAAFIGPGDWGGAVKGGGGGELRDCHGRGEEGRIFAYVKECLGERGEKLEDPGLGPLMLAEGFEVEEDIN